MRTNTTISLAILVIAFGSVPAMGTEYTFIATEGTWDDSFDWTPSGGPPVDGDKATIPDGKTCSVTDYDAACDNFVVADGGTLIIEDDGTLTADGAADNEVEGLVVLRGILTIDNDFYLGTSECSGTLRVGSEDGQYTSEINGEGKIILHDDPVGFLEGTGTLKVDIENDGEAGAWGPGGFGCGSPWNFGPCEGPLVLEGTLTGTGRWRAIDGLASSVGGELIVDTVVSAFTGQWRTFDGAANRIVFKKAVCVATSAQTGTGLIKVDGDAGLQIEGDFCTMGHLQMAVLGAPYIKVAKGRVPRFNVSTCQDCGE